jgi:TRAP-type C4-dicarboxylate transport system permease small subunit
VRAASALLALLRRLETIGTALAFATMVVVLGWDIVGRELLSSGKIWATPIAVYCNVFIAFIGMGVASAGGAHLRPKFLDKAAPAALDGLFNRFTDIGFALFAAGACWLCLQVTRESVELAETDPVLQWQVWPFQVILVVAFGIAVVRHLLYALYPALKPKESGGENAPPSEEQVRQFAPPVQEKAR